MKVPKTRVAVLGAAVAVLQLSLAASSSAATGTGTCVPLPLPPNATSVSNVSLCVGADVFLDAVPTSESEQCGGFGSCKTYYVSYGITGSADTGVTFCYTEDGVETCAAADVGPAPFELVQPDRMCVGYDLRGGFPCPNGEPIDPDV